MIDQSLGRYRIIEPIDERGFAKVYLAEHVKIRYKAIIKVLEQRDIPDFHKEAEVAGRLGGQHHIIGLHDYDEQDGIDYFVQEYVPGRSLKQALADQPGQPAAATLVREVATAISDALDFAHSQGIIHRDLRPAKILLGDDGQVLLTDFGVATLQDATGRPDDFAVDPPTYVSPEKALGWQLDARSDVYSFAVVLYELLTGRTPYQADSAMALRNMHVYWPLPLPRQLNQSLPESAEWILLKGLAKHPDARYASAGALARDLLAELDGTSARSQEEPPQQPADEW